MQPTLIPHTDCDFASIKYSPLSSPEINPAVLQDDPQCAAYWRKQMHLLTIHECFGHLSFGIFKLMV